MSRKHEEMTRKFQAEDEEGNAVTLYVYTTIITTHELSGATHRHEGMKSIRTGDGEHVNRTAKGQYQIVVTGKTLRSNEPDAP